SRSAAARSSCRLAPRAFPARSAMRFHDYLTLQRTIIRFGHNEDVKRMFRETKPADARAMIFATEERRLVDSHTARDRDTHHKRLMHLSAERTWLDIERPFYNFYPVIVELAKKVKLELLFDEFRSPFDCIVMRFARGHEPFGFATAMVCWQDQAVHV